MIGSTILHYNILEKLGQGGMGVVYLAEDINLERKVAIKFLPKHISENTEERQRFKIEAKAAAKLNHPNIATIYSIEETENELFIVMEYIKGIELSDKIKAGVVPSNEAIKIGIQIAGGLEAAHNEGIIHRDIKSSNIMITESGVVKVMDFGLAKLKGTSKLTKMGSTVGTIAYMSPEQSRSDEVDNRTDLWSFGVVFYEMLTGKLPFRGDYDQAIIYSILNEEPHPAGEIDKGIQKIIDKSLKKNREERYSSAGEISEDLRTISKGGEVKKAKVNTKIPWLITGAAIIIIAIAIYLFMPSSKSGQTTEKIKTIAVLPFADLSPNKDQGYFSDGLSGELINVLSKNSKLRVTARTSSFSFKGTNADIKTIASKLNVSNILEGSVQKAGNNLRISADLVNVETDATLWSNTYNGTMNNIFALQDSISGNVAEALNAALLGKEAVKSEQKTDPEAYNDYLLGEHFLNLSGKENLETAEGYYKKAILIDSIYAPAWVGLSTVHTYQAGNGYVPVDDGFRNARNEIETALDLNPKLADAYAQLGNIKSNYNWDWTGADEAYKKGLALEPENTKVINGASNLAAILGQYDEAIKLTRKVIEIDPVNVSGYSNLAEITYYKGLLDESITATKKSLELNPLYPGEHMTWCFDYLRKGKPDSALEEIKKEPEPWMHVSGIAMVYYASGRKKEADEKLAEFIKDFQNVGAYQVAEIYAFRNEKEKAFEWLERAYRQHDIGCILVKNDPLLRNLFNDPRYTAFLKKMKLPL
jgi:eukaryotic-like serine/threonine-protein kinase